MGLHGGCSVVKGNRRGGLVRDALRQPGGGNAGGMPLVALVLGLVQA